LNEEGKLPEGRINELMTGGLEFTINRYGAERTQPRNAQRAESGRLPLPRDDQFFGNNENENQTLFEIAGAARDINDPFLDVTQPDGTNGPNQPFTLDDIADEFDGESLNIGDSKCTCCYGTGFVGGYSLLGGWRKVIAPHLPEVYEVEGTIEVNTTPNAFNATRVEIDLVLPRGFVVLDAFRFWNNIDRAYPDRVFIDNLPYSVQLLMAFCDGRKHRIRVEYDEPKYWTHLEVQIGLSRNPALIEFPRLMKGSNLSLADLTEGVQINASPVIPHLATLDVFVESTFGKTFLITNSNLWNDKDRNVHGWDCQTRVIQPSEMLSLLPRRRKLNQRTTNPVRDNVDGIRRT
jgi:hypothetical protein